MEKYFDILIRCPLFNQITKEDLLKMLVCLGARIEFYRKDEMIFSEGEPAMELGIVLSGSTQIERIDYYGNRSILATIMPSQLFGESFACVGVESLPVNVVATLDTEVMLIDAGRITRSCNTTCGFHSQMIYNLLKVVAGKNLQFHQKIEVTSKRSTREKLMTYLLLQAKEQGSNYFEIPYDRQRLADYLEVDRSGLSAEISKLRAEGVLECRKNHFTIL